MSTIFIGIAGGTGSGKTTLTRHLKEHFGDAVTVIGHDSYYKRQDGKTYEERSKVNYDHPDAFETSLLVEHLKALKAGRSIQCPVYSYVDHNRTDETVEVFPTKVIIVEGILIFQDPTLRDMFDIKIFVETDADVPKAVERWLGGDTEGLIRRKDLPGKYLVDLRGALRRRLIQLGLSPEHIAVSDECTMCLHDKYWSHRYTRGGPRGSQCAVICL